MDRLSQIQMFVAITEANSFAGAARRLGVSPPAVTRAINELESQLGVRLLTRTTRAVRLTEAGERYVERCRRIIEELAQADESVSGPHGTPRGRLVLTAPALLGTLVVTPIVTEYLRLFPEVQADCLLVDRIVNLVEEGVDVGVRIGELPDSSLQAIRVGAVSFVIVASPSHLERFGVPARPEDLAGHPLVTALGVASTPEWLVQADGAPLELKLTARMKTTSNDGALAAAREGFGITRLISYQVAEDIAAGRLVRLLPEFEPPTIPVHVVHREGRYASRKARTFIDLAVERLRSHPALRK